MTSENNLEPEYVKLMDEHLDELTEGSPASTCSRARAWTVKRYLVEEWDVEAVSREDAIEQMSEGSSGCSIRIIKETAKPRRANAHEQPPTQSHE